MRRFLSLTLAALLASTSVSAAVFGSSGGGVSSGAAIHGSPSAGDCVSWYSPSTVQDAGAGCNGGWFTGYIPGNWYLPPYTTVAAGSALASSSIHCVPFVTVAPLTVKGIMARVSTAYAGGNVQLAVFASNPTTGRPGALLGNTGNLSVGSVGLIGSTGDVTAFALPEGVNFACANADNATVALMTFAGQFGPMAFTFGSSTPNNIADSATSSRLILTAPQGFGTWSAGSTYTWTESTSQSSFVPELQSN